jgi:hypothetical protein
VAFIPGGAAISAKAALQRRAGRVKRVYYPAAVLRLRIRLEDFSNEDGAVAAQESKPAASQASRAAKLARDSEAESSTAAGLAQARVGDPAGVDVAAEARGRVAAAQAAVVATGDASPPDNVPPDDLSITVAVVPLECRVEGNSFRIADKLTASFSLADLPITPEIVRSMLVEAYFGTSSAADFGDPQRWIPPLLQTQAPDFRGYADVEDMTAGDDFRVTIQARSLEALLIDAKVHPMVKERRIQRSDSYTDPETGVVVRGERVTRFLKRFIATVPAFSGKNGAGTIGVRIYPNFDPAREPVLSASVFLRSLQTAQSRAQAGGQVQASPPGPSGDAQAGVGTPMVPAATPGEFSAWDVVVRAAELCGFIPTYDPSIVAVDPVSGELIRGADNILLIPPQTLKETPQEGVTIPGGPVDGFSRQMVPGGLFPPLRTQVRFMVWGSNIKALKWSRKFGRIKAPAVRVVSYDPDGAAGKRVISAQYPKTPRGTLASPSGTGRGGLRTGHQPTTEVVTKVIRGVRSQKLLNQIAVAFYHAISRHEMTCMIDTDEMASYIDPTMPDTHNENPDLLKLRSGTPIRVTVMRRKGDQALDSLSNLFEQRFNPAFLRKSLLQGSGATSFVSTGRQTLDQALAKIEASFAKAKLTDWFYVKTIVKNWSVDDGFSLQMEVANFVEARNLPANLSAGDAKANDELKLVKPLARGRVDRRAAAEAARQDAADANKEDLLEKQATGAT